MAHPSIADAVVIKDGGLFLVSQPSGDVPLGDAHGLGLYLHDCRYLGGYALTLGDGVPPQVLGADAARGFAARLTLTNPELALADHRTLAAHELGVVRERVLVGQERTMREVITLRSFAAHPIVLRVTLAFRAEFEDVFVVRRIRPAPASRKRHFETGEGRLVFTYHGEDGLTRATEIEASPPPAHTRASTLAWDVRLDAHGTAELTVTIRLVETRREEPETASSADPSASAPARAELHRSVEDWIGEHTAVTSDSRLLDATLRRSLVDLRLLRNERDGLAFFSAGVPWYVTLFGRDTLIASLEVLAFEPEVAAETLRLLARHQGTKTDEHRDEEPGKILHEYRVGELANTGEIPFDPYYGTVDATLLFLIVLARHATWTGRLDLFRELEAAVAKAIAWAEGNMDRNPGGWVSYDARSAHGLDNHGWKDSEDAIVNADASLADPPIALAEVQGYTYLAFTSVARLYERDGKPGEAARLDARAAAIKERFDRRFWLEREGVYAMALQANDRPAAVVSSNAGQALWSGIAAPEKARRTVERLMREDMWSGWGVRTLSRDARAYNPIGYHLGTVWPHDNAIVAAGFRRYGHDEEACRVFAGILELAAHFPYHRLPELVTGFARGDLTRPVPYPVACHPQAWAAGSVPFLLETALGLVPDGFSNRLRVVRPSLPELVSRLDLSGLRVGSGRVDLRFERAASGALDVRVLRATEGLHVDVEPKG